jgi:hypothetical protein
MTKTSSSIQNSTGVGIATSNSTMKRISVAIGRLIDKDLSRTRSNEEYFTKKSTRQLLKRITTFYCISNKIHYQQGLLEVVIPFALLHRPDF